MNTICQGFVEPPEACKYKKADPNPAKGGLGVGWIVLIVVLVTFITLISIWCYKRMLSRTLDMTIEDAIRQQATKKFGEYKALSENKVSNPTETK